MKKLAYVFSLHFLLVGCYNDNEEELYPNSNCNTVNVNYNNQIKLLFEAKCAVSGCHVAGATSPTLADYTMIKNNIDRIKVRVIEERTMPPSNRPALTQCEIDKLNKWITDGANNN